MANNLNDLFKKELFKRIISVIFFVPLVLLPIFLNNYSVLFIYLLFNALILAELIHMKSNRMSAILINIYALITIFSFFAFIFLFINKSYTTILLVEFILTIWLFDTFSYLGGKLIGGVKLMPSISAGKTISGLIIGTLVTIIVMQLYKYLIYDFQLIYLFQSICIIALSFLGDVTASVIKRISQVKDSGNIMPGHGGLFDRFDSFIAVFCFFGLIKLF